MDYTKCVATISRGPNKGQRCSRGGYYRIAGFPDSCKMRTCDIHRVSKFHFYGYGDYAPAWFREFLERGIRMRHEANAVA